MAPTARLPPKKDVALALLEQASMYIHLDPRGDSVHVPVWFKKQPQLVLQVGLNMAVPIPDLRVTDEGLSCTLSFNRSPFFCSIPWRAVFALVGEKGQAMVWAEDVPAEVAAQAQAQKQPQERPRAHLRPVGEGETAPAQPAPARAEEVAEETPTKKAATKKPARAAKEGEPKRAAKGGAKKPAAKKGEAEKASTAKKPSEKEAAVKPQPRPKAAVAAKPAEKPAAGSAASETSKPKRELPPYLRVVK